MSALLKRCGKNLKLAPAVHIYNPKRLSLGDNVYIGYNSYIGDGDITFDDEVVLGPFCSVTGGNHLYRDGSVRFGGYEYKPVHIGKGTWLGPTKCPYQCGLVCTHSHRNEHCHRGTDGSHPSRNKKDRERPHRQT